ncbi:MAG: winged helix-turn-helix domain-containing protein, partial [Halobacteriales archaeon]|nr:winged helix-turn-helix domain-containing protein [Halobacteriales archaeon]
MLADEPEKDEALAGMLSALASPTRLRILRQLRSPKTLREIEVPAAAHGARAISRQAVREHLDKLLEIQAVNSHASERTYGEAQAYVVNNQVLFALTEEFRGLARLRPTVEPVGQTLRGQV